MSNKRKLWYRENAGNFTEALPIGNGELGGMVYGNAPEGRITLNLDTLWSGTGTKPENIPEKGILEKVRRLIFAGKYFEAEQIAQSRLLGFFNESYMPMGSFNYTLNCPGAIGNFSRNLDLEEGICNSEFKIGDTVCKLNIFASYPAKAIVYHIEAEENKKISMTFSMDSQLKHQKVFETGHWVELQGCAPSHVEPNYVECEEPVIYDENAPGLKFAARAMVHSTDGTVTYGEQTEIKNAGSATIIITATDSYQGYGKPIACDYESLDRILEERYERLAEKTYEELSDEHKKDYRALYARVDISFGEKDMPTDRRLLELKQGAEDSDMYALFFQYGRYLLIASSRKGTQAANLQGIWNEDLRAAWSGNYTVNINTEMNYWAACGGNLAECQEPMHDLIREMSLNGKKTAENQYACRGWAANHNVDLWRHTNPVAGLPKYAYWPMGGVWMSASLYDYYLFTQDRDFLKNTAYPILEGCVRFCLDWLCEGPDRMLHTCPSTSPENVFYDEARNICSMSYSCTLDISLVRELFRNFMEIAGIIPVDEKLREAVQGALERLPDIQVGPDGCIQEWIKPFPEVEPGHRHLTPVYGLHPGNLINEYDSPELVTASQKFLEKRLINGGGHTGWSCAWLISMYARLREREKAGHYLEQLLKKSVYKNLFDLHPPLGEGFEGEREVFQIDGNFGGVEGMLNMLLQSHLGELYLLPALPEMLGKGYAKGLCARGGFEVELQWEEMELTRAVILSKKGNMLKIRCDIPIAVYERDTGEFIQKSDNGRVEISTREGIAYNVLPMKDIQDK